MPRHLLSSNWNICLLKSDTVVSRILNAVLTCGIIVPLNLLSISSCILLYWHLFWAVHMFCIYSHSWHKFYHKTVSKFPLCSSIYYCLCLPPFLLILSCYAWSHHITSCSKIGFHILALIVFDISISSLMCMLVSCWCIYPLTYIRKTDITTWCAFFFFPQFLKISKDTIWVTLPIWCQCLYV